MHKNNTLWTCQKVCEALALTTKQQRVKLTPGPLRTVSKISHRGWGGGGGGRQGGGVKTLLQLANFTLGPDATLNTEIHNNSVRIRLPTQSMHQSENIKIKLIIMINKDEYSLLIVLYARVK